MNKLYVAVVVIMAAVASAAVVKKALERNSQENKLADMQRSMEAASNYDRGFVAGMNATLRHVNIVSNRVDIAPIIDEMKP